MEEELNEQEKFVVEEQQEKVDEQPQENANYIEDVHQHEEEGDIEDIDNELEIEGFHDEKEAEKFTLKKLKHYHEALEEKEKIEFLVEYNGMKDLVYITVEKNFLKSDIVACIQEYVRKIDVLRTKGIEMQSGFLEMYLIFMIIKHFTDIEMPKSIENQMVVLQRLIDTGLLFNIFIEFPRTEINKVLEEVQAMKLTLEENYDELKESFTDIDQESLSSETVKKMLNDELSKE